MTLKQYFSTPQPINDTTNEVGEYTETSSIDFKSADGMKSASILVAHVGDKLYAFGWRISDYPSSAIKRMPTMHAVTKGDFHKLIYGMTKVLESKLRKKFNSKEMFKLIQDAEKEAELFYAHKDIPTEKILITDGNNINAANDQARDAASQTLEFI